MVSGASNLLEQGEMRLEQGMLHCIALHCNALGLTTLTTLAIHQYPNLDPSIFIICFYYDYKTTLAFAGISFTSIQFLSETIAILN